MTTFTHRLYLIFGETKITERADSCMKHEVILSCPKKFYRTAITQNKIKQVKHSAEIEKQILFVKGKSDKEKAAFLMELMEMGYTYDDFLKYQQERLSLEDEINNADYEHDTLIDD